MDQLASHYEQLYFNKIARIQEEKKQLLESQKNLKNTQETLEKENDELDVIIKRIESLEAKFNEEKERAMALERENAKLMVSNASMKKANEEKKALLKEKTSKF